MAGAVVPFEERTVGQQVSRVLNVLVDEVDAADTGRGDPRLSQPGTSDGGSQHQGERNHSPEAPNCTEGTVRHRHGGPTLDERVLDC